MCAYFRMCAYWGLAQDDKVIGPARRADPQTHRNAMYRVTQWIFPEWDDRAPRAAAPSVDDRVSRLAQRRVHLGAVIVPLRLQVQLDLHLREPEPWIGPYMAHVEDVGVRH